MSAFARRCHFMPLRFAPRPPNFFVLYTSRSCQKSRSSSPSVFLRATKQTHKAPAAKQPHIKTKAPLVPSKVSNAPPVYRSFAATLAQKSHPTLLYQAPSHTLFLISSYSASFFCLSYAGFAFYANSLHPPDGLSTWIPIAFGGICFLMACLGGWLLLGPARLIKTITAIPQRSTANTLTGLGRVNLSKPVASQPGLIVEVELRKMFPLPILPARKVYMDSEELVLPTTLSVVDTKLTAAQLMVVRQIEDEEKKKLLEYERSHIMTRPFRDASRAFQGVFVAIRRTWSREGFLKIKVNGRMYKLDVVGGWALDGGKALDRLATIKPAQ